MAASLTGICSPRVRSSSGTWPARALLFWLLSRRLDAASFADASLIRAEFCVSWVDIFIWLPPLWSALLETLAQPFRIASAALTRSFVRALLALAASQYFIFDCFFDRHAFGRRPGIVKYTRWRSCGSWLFCNALDGVEFYLFDILEMTMLLTVSADARSLESCCSFSATFSSLFGMLCVCWYVSRYDWSLRTDFKRDALYAKSMRSFSVCCLFCRVVIFLYFFREWAIGRAQARLSEWFENMLLGIWLVGVEGARKIKVDFWCINRSLPQ